MKDNQYFVDLREKFDIMEKHVVDIKDMVTKIRTSLNELSLDLQNGRVTSIEEAKRRVDSIRMFGTEIPPKGCEDVKVEQEQKCIRPLVKCKKIGARIYPTEVNMELGSHISDALSKDGIQGVFATIRWFIQHMIDVDVEIKIDSPQHTDVYTDCQLLDLILVQDSDDPVLMLGKYEEMKSIF